MNARRTSQLTGLGRVDAHEARKEGVDSSQDFGVAAGHARSNAPLQGFEMGQDGLGLQHRQQEAEDLQSGADVGDVSLRLLLLRGHPREPVSGVKKKEEKKGLCTLIKSTFLVCSTRFQGPLCFLMDVTHLRTPKTNQGKKKQAAKRPQHLTLRF